MKTKTIALTTSALVAVAAFASTASAAGAYMGKVNLGVGNNWENFHTSGSNFDDKYTSILGGGAVNIPYDDVVNLQFDVAGYASLDNQNNGDGANSYNGGFQAAAHMNYRDNMGALGVFAGLGRASVGETNSSDNAAFFMAGLEGQYFCNAWTLSAQVGYLDGDSTAELVHNAGFIIVGANYYPSSKLKLSGQVGYLDGETSGSDPADVTNWNWGVGVEYMFGKTIPVSTYLEYRGQRSEVKWNPTESIDRDMVNVGVRFYFGTDDLMKADRDGAGMVTPDALRLSQYDTK
jgi:hypothetical protein